MSYQPNAYRKFIATAATATLVASAVAPAASAADFTDVPARYQDAVDFVVSKGVNGLTPTTYGTNEPIKRVDAAVMIANVLDLDTENAPDAGFTDVPARAQGAVNALKEAGITSGKTATTFDANSPITRGELAIWIYKGFGLKGSAEVPFTDVSDRYDEAVSAMVANDITQGVSETRFGVSQEAKRGDYAIFLYKSHLAVDAPIVASGVSGFILDGNEPVVGATVTADGKTATTDENGFYNITNVTPGTQTVTVEANGFKTIKVSDVKVLTDKITSFTRNIADAEINTSEIQVSGVVVDSQTGNAVSGADVTLQTYDSETEEWSTVAGVQTDSTGKYVIDQAAASSNLQLGGNYRLTVSLDGYKADVQDIALYDQEVNNVLKGIELDAIAPMSVTGTVTNGAGANVSGAAVTIFDAEGTEIATTSTNANGVYNVEDLQLISGTYNVVVDHEGSAVSYTEFEVTEGTNATHNVKLQAGNDISAAIGTESLSDTFGAGTYTLELLNGKTVIGTEEVTLSNSANTLSFDFSRVAPGTYTLRLSGDYVATEEFSLTVDGDESFEGRAVPAGKITGTANADATISLVDANGNIVETTTANDSGAYSFTGVTAGGYTVQASKAGYVAAESDDLAVTKNNTTEVAAFNLNAVDTTGDVAGFVRASGTLAPVTGATVTYYDQDGEEVETATVAANGGYSISDLEAGTYKIVVRGAGVETYTTTQAVKAGDSLTAVNYTLAQGGNASLKVSVVDSEGDPVNVAVNGFDLSDAFADESDPTAGIWEQANTATNTVTFSNLSAGTYDLDIDVLSEDYVDEETAVSVAKGEAAELTIVVDEVAEQSAVNFRVVDERNANVEGASVVVFSEDGTVKDVLSTNASGAADLALVDGNYTLAVYRNGYVVAHRSVTVAGDDVTVPVIQLTPVQ